MARPTPSELFIKLVPHYDDGTYLFAKSGCGMACMAKADPDADPEIYLLNIDKRKAWQIVGWGALSWWNAADIEIASLSALPYEILNEVLALEVRYSLEVKDFADGVALVEWTFLIPGKNDDYRETSLYAYIDTNATVVIPFQPMDDAMKEQYRRQAIDILQSLSDPARTVEYVCLQPDLTVPAEENLNLAAHTDFLEKVVAGAMYRFKSMAINLNVYPDFQGVMGIDTVLNPGREHMSMLLTGIRTQENPLKFDVRVQVALSRPGCPPRAVQVRLGICTVEQIHDSMSVTGNVHALADYLKRSAIWLYSDEPGVPYHES